VVTCDNGADAASARAQTQDHVPDAQQMVSLLGPGDEDLKLIEKALASDIHVRGNEITISGADRWTTHGRGGCSPSCSNSSRRRDTDR